jgi:hypothetical protein
LLRFQGRFLKFIQFGLNNADLHQDGVENELYVGDIHHAVEIEVIARGTDSQSFIDDVL